MTLVYVSLFHIGAHEHFHCESNMQLQSKARVQRSVRDLSSR